MKVAEEKEQNLTLFDSKIAKIELLGDTLVRSMTSFKNASDSQIHLTRDYSRYLW